MMLATIVAPACVPERIAGRHFQHAAGGQSERPMNRPHRMAALLLGGALLAGGCGPSDDQPRGRDTGAVDDRLKEVAISDLKTGVGEYMPPLDEGRIELALPEGWKFLSRHADYVVRFYHADPNSLPRILVTVEEATWDAAPTVSRENVEDFARHVARQLDENDTKLIEPVKPMMIGPTPCARYVAAGKHHDVAVERQVIQTQLADRVYTIELQVFEGTILQYRDAGYAVAASLRPAASAKPDDSNDESGQSPSDTATTAREDAN
jgi:hypothetical protein